MLSQALRSIRPSFSQIAAFTLALSSMTFAGAEAPHPVADRLTSPIVESARVTLGGSVHHLASKANDRGAVSDGMKLDRVQIVLKRSDAQERALKQLIGDLHTQGTASYHKWLTPDDFGKQFGPSDADVTKLESWLASKGFGITKLNAGRQTLEIAGTAGQFKSTFHTEVHSFQVPALNAPLDGSPKTETRYSTVGNPDIPAALAPVFGGFVSLNNFRFKSHAQLRGRAGFNPTTHEVKPDWTVGTSASPFFLLGPADFAVQYDLNPLYAAGTKGDGQSIAIINEANINIAQVNNYRALFGLPVNPPQVIIDGNDPGIDGINSPFGPNGASGEAYLDVELSGAAAPDAQINLVIANDTALESGLTLAIERAVYSNISPVISLSFGGCEADQGGFNGFISSLWEQAAAQGITAMVSTGDSGSAGCDNDNSQYFAVGGQAVNGLGSTPYNVAVGGTDFYYSGGAAGTSTYWSATNGTGLVSLKSKVPEQPFNSSQYGVNLDDYYADYGGTQTTIFAAGGGASTAGAADGSGNYTLPYPKPSWQTGAGVPADGARDLPDVSLFGALASSLTITPACANDGDCIVAANGEVNVSTYGGTSLSSPSFAGIMALVNQKYGRQGQANYVLYPLAAQFPSAFNDVTTGTNSVPCSTQTVFDLYNSNASVPSKECLAVSSPLTVTDPRYGTSAEGEISVTGKVASYNAGTGYDLASGLGSVDANNLLTDWGKITLASTTSTLVYTVPTGTATPIPHGTTVTVSGKVTGTGTTVPSGSVALITSSTEASNQGQTMFTLDSTGTYSGTINYLPGGTYNLSVNYSGDGVNGPSTSALAPITIGSEASTTTLSVYNTRSNNFTPGALTSGSSFAYGSFAALSAQIAPSSSAEQKAGYTYPTGSVNFLSGTSILNTSVLNAEGDAEYNSALAASATPYSITAVYSGDGSYTASTSAATTFTVTKATPTLSLYIYNPTDSNNNLVNGQTNYLSVFLENANSVNALALAPTGTLTMTDSTTGTTTTATLVPAVNPQNSAGNQAPVGAAYFTLPTTTTGTQALTFSYAGDTNYGTKSTSYMVPYVNQGGAATTITAVPSATATSPTAPVALSVTVTGSGSNGAPAGSVYLNSTSGYYFTAANLTQGTGLTSTFTFRLSSGALFPGTNQIIVQYYPAQGSPYNSAATEVTIANPLSDFSLIPVSPIVSLATSGTATDVINLASYQGFTGAVNLTCSATGGVTCSLGSSSATLAAGGSTSVTLSLSGAGVTTAGTYNVLVTGTDATGKYIHTAGIQVQAPVGTGVTPPTGTYTLSGTAITIASQGGSGTSPVMVTPTGGFTGTVALTCAVTSSPSGATEVPTCSLSPASASVTSATAVASTLTINTTAQTASLAPASKSIFGLGSGVVLAVLLFCGVPVGRRGRMSLKAVRTMRILSVALLFALIAGAGIGCGGGSNPPPPASGGTTTGAYTVTVTGTSGATTVTTAVAVTVN